MLYSKNGSIPKHETDNTEGWVEVPEPPVAPSGMEVVWWSPPGWVVRPVMPDPVEGHCWSWSQSETKWVLCVEHDHGGDVLIIQPEPIEVIMSSAMPSAGPTITF